MVKKISYWIIVFFCILSNLTTSAQITKVRGVIRDSETNEVIPFVNVTFKNSTIGTITNTDGEYFLETRTYYDSLIVSFVGYKKQSSFVQKNRFQEINFNLEPNIYALEEIVVLPTENPAHPILRNIIANKEKHNPRKFDSYNYKLYNKVEIDINNVDDKMRETNYLKIFSLFSIMLILLLLQENHIYLFLLLNHSQIIILIGILK